MEFGALWPYPIYNYNNNPSLIIIVVMYSMNGGVSRRSRVVCV